ncbi:hypothetical protein 2050H1_011 [Serratia phage 2050H1]|uniref:Uncharacterized protein n=1 Tax=Serratia phage 2050H1 TaxID=2024250 RepID=A0A249Y277_9CAUD|nr:hypothetical protein 2050H1_011 [Serratia phage 2050H1]
MKRIEHFDIAIGLMLFTLFVTTLFGYMVVELPPVAERICLVTAIINAVGAAYLLLRREISRVLE